MTAAQSQNTIFQQPKLWFQAIRPPSLTAATIPVLAGAAWAFHEKTPADWQWLPLIWLAAVSIQAATNLVSEYYDYLKGNITHGSTRVIVEGLLSPRQFLIGGLVLFAFAAAIGLAFIALRGWPIMVIGLVGILGGYFYTATPVGYKYIGLGDILVFVLMGPLMVIGSYFVLTGTYNHNVLLVSLPIGCLVAAILSGNNLRDMLPDSQAGITTTAGLLGHRWAKIEYCALDISAYLITAALVAARILPAWSLITVLSVPLAYQCVRRALGSAPNKPQQLADIDIRTAKLHLAFGILLIISLLPGASGK
ncbi:MAG: 1,4-dihydroxy-2-naphthoate octaprenyltransferase [Planctomycetes bacterium]|nr:1,4-dihydroxy-2-naphthoate octaprenyltransferase [Planctomycetota bacterium]